MSLPYTNMGPCAFCGGDDAGHRVADGMWERVAAGETIETQAAEYGLTVDQVRGIWAFHGLAAQ